MCYSACSVRQRRILQKGDEECIPSTGIQLYFASEKKPPVKTKVKQRLCKSGTFRQCVLHVWQIVNQKRFFDSKCIKSVWRPRAPPGPTGGAYCAPFDLLAGFEDVASRQGRTENGVQNRQNGESLGDHPPSGNSWIRHWFSVNRILSHSSTQIQCSKTVKSRTVSTGQKGSKSST